MVKEIRECRSKLIQSETDAIPTTDNQSEHLLSITNIKSEEPTLISRTNVSSKNSESDSRSSNFTIRQQSDGHVMHLIMKASTSNIDLKKVSENSVNSAVAVKSTVQREYQLLAQKFHQYTINCRTTIRTLEKKLQKLIDDKHALLHGMVSLRKGQKDVIKKYRKIFNDAMNVSFCVFLEKPSLDFCKSFHSNRNFHPIYSKSCLDDCKVSELDWIFERRVNY